MPYTKREWVDELLAEDPKYLITLSTRDGETVSGEDAGDIFDEKARIELNVDTLVDGTPINASIMNDMENRVEAAVAGLDTRVDNISLNSGEIGEKVDRLDAQNVKLTTAQSISGVKTFSALPVTPVSATGDTQLTNRATVNAIVNAAKPQLRTTTVTGGGWTQASDNGQTVYRKTTGITGAGTAFPMLAAASGHLAQLNASFLQAVNVDGTIWLYSDVAITTSIAVSILLIERR